MSDFPSKQFYNWFKENFGYTRLQRLDKCIDTYGSLENCVKEIMTVAFDDIENEHDSVDELFWGLIKKVMSNKAISSPDNR
ncbi:hypothetical protein AFV1_ORF80 [Captovirus AFV1]|uniref:Uncharacterized protein ORF80 n=1 Tax=Acidianus filamentous virus 1 (isolate United States/Yellowstone) TaxID=654909 RepID=Y080_AFV1Y|nr:hypothetical protein AFV1_ORF80 [Captovirus AFV1]Q70LB7.1 RecName: Full=Uncharacterized protein ORF80 [Acidianus filamentous virus 1 (isolate Yellowstone)]CAD98963.1 hypothetical protein [Captovirus AFV1]